jgi:hypothetical protein
MRCLWGDTLGHQALLCSKSLPVLTSAMNAVLRHAGPGCGGTKLMCLCHLQTKYQHLSSFSIQIFPRLHASSVLSWCRCLQPLDLCEES